ncbi:MAG: PAS domain S-box protein [Planctomycetaceae bacterium]
MNSVHDIDESQPAVLLVDDEPDMVRGLARLLRLDGFRVESAGSIAEMLDGSNWSDYIAILVDRKLPDGFAEDVLPQLKELAPDAVIIVITGHSDLQSTIASFRAGAEDYLIKPIDPEVLRHRLRRINELRQTRRALQREEDQRKQSERELHDREERLQSILKTAADAIITMDRRGIIVEANPATERLFGYARDELIGRNVKILMPPPYHDEHDGYIARYLETREARIIGIGREVVGRRKDGRTFPVDLAVSEVGHLGLFTGIIRDISERKRLQEHILEIAADEQRRIGQELHDGTGQELTALSLFAGTLLDILNTAEQAAGEETTWRLDDSAYRRLQKTAASLSHGLTDANRHVHQLSQGIMSVQIDAEGLRSALKELAETTDAQERITCHFKSTGTVAVFNNTTAKHMYRIAQEALNNALRHSRADQIDITLSSRNDQIVLEVCDNGIGIDPAARHRPDRPEGGMGLRTMAYRASLIGGMLHIERNSRGGTTVGCTISQGSRSS